MAASNPEVSGAVAQPAHEAAEPAQSGADSLVPPEDLSEVQSALYALHQSFLGASARLREEQKVLAIMARKTPDEIARELPRRIAGTTVKIVADAFVAMSQIIAVFSDVEARVASLEEIDDLGEVVGSADDLHSFLTDVVALCEAHRPFALTDEGKSLLAHVLEQAQDMLSRLVEEEPGEEPAEEPEADAEPNGEDTPDDGEDQAEESDNAS